MRIIPRSLLNFYSSRRGFTLIELMMTIVVVSIVAIPLSLLLSQHISSVFQSEDYTLAVNLARLEMEQINNMNYTNIVSADFSNYQGYNYTLNRTVAYVAGDQASPESLKKMTVVLRKPNDPKALLSLVAYIAKNIAYGL